jgi:hypothetical protein
MMVAPSNQDKPAWCRIGEQREHAFLGRRFKGCAFRLNPAKAGDKYTHDLVATLPCDLKSITTRFRKAEELYGVPSRSAVTINRKDLRRYESLYPGIIIVLDVDYGDFRRTCFTTLPQMRSLIEQGKAHLHQYKDRIDDTHGNAKESYVVDSMLFQEIEEERVSFNNEEN